MNMVKVFIKGQEDKELSSFLRYYPTRIKNVGIDGVFDRQTIFDFKDGCNQPQVAQFVAKELVRKFGRKIGKVVRVEEIVEDQLPVTECIGNGTGSGEDISE